MHVTLLGINGVGFTNTVTIPTVRRVDSALNTDSRKNHQAGFQIKRNKHTRYTLDQQLINKYK